MCLGNSPHSELVCSVRSMDNGGDISPFGIGAFPTCENLPQLLLVVEMVALVLLVPSHLRHLAPSRGLSDSVLAFVNSRIAC